MMSSFHKGGYIRSIAIKRETIVDCDEYPFNLPVIRQFESLELHPSVTFLAGENGTGKSTLLEAMAVAAGFNPEGGSKSFNFATRETHACLHEYIRLIRGVRRPKDGFFLRAESFYNAATYLEKEVPTALSGYGGKSLHQRSHGEAFMALLTNRFSGKGLYILDEPEAALSPNRQMAVLPVIHDLVNKDSQFVIATHSPIILAYPNARIYVLSEDGITETPYEKTEHFMIARSFFTHMDTMMSELLLRNDENTMDLGVD